MRISKVEQARRKADLAFSTRYVTGLVEDGRQVLTIIRNVTRDGQRTDITMLVADGKNAVVDISRHVARILGEGYSETHQGVSLHAGGMDMGWYLVHRLGQALYPNGFQCHGDGCRSGDHSQGQPFRAGHVLHRDGGYAIGYR